MKYKIINWMGQDCNLYGKREFDSFQDAREEIDKFATDLTEMAIEQGKYKRDSRDHEDSYTGICEDLYAVISETVPDKPNERTKEEARESATDWQSWQQEKSLSYSELAEWSEYFYKLGRKFGLVREFRENGII
jgi:hypothetical protein